MDTRGKIAVTTNVSATVEERLASIEATLPHLATKADLAELRAELHSMKWMIGVGIAAAGVVGPLFTWLLSWAFLMPRG